jgi:7-keto-8-aminopelargonate synthetase-like enzyme
MKNLSSQIELVNQIVDYGVNLGLIQVKATDYATNGRTIQTKDKTLTYFGNCSYLGLEHDPRIKEATIDAINRYGLQFACSRTYSSLSLYDELESLLSQIFGKPTLVAPTTSIGHVANMTTIIRAEDAIILDHQVHASVKNAVMIAKASGTHVETIRHNRMDMLESRIIKLKEVHNKVWYMADGVYSMYGDCAPFDELHELMDRHEEFWCYIDDAHGMSWTGKNGQGFALSHFPSFHDKLVLAVSLVKGFGVHGGALIYPNEYMRNVVKNCGSSLMFASPMPPAYLAANIASAKIHLTDEINILQSNLKDLISYFTITAKGMRVPLINEEMTPIFFIPVGYPEAGYAIMKELYDNGFLVNLSAFPAVPYKNTGLRAILTNHHTKDDIYELLSAVKNAIQNYEQMNTVNLNVNITKAFGLVTQNG